MTLMTESTFEWINVEKDIWIIRRHGERFKRKKNNFKRKIKFNFFFTFNRLLKISLSISICFFFTLEKLFSR